MTSDLPQIRILTREKFSVRVKTLADAANSKLSLNSDIFVRPEDSTWVSSSYTSVVSSNGKYVAVTEKSGIKVYDLSSSPAEIQGSVEEGQSKGYPLVSFIEVENVEAVHFSPDASLLISWSRRSGDKDNMFVWRVQDATPLAGFYHRTYSPSSWPLIDWSKDSKIAVRAAKNEIQIFDGAFARQEGGAQATPMETIEVKNLECVFVSPAPAPTYSFVSFAPTIGNAMACYMMWTYSYGGKYVCTTSKNINADSAHVRFAEDGSAALVEMITKVAENSYYGDSKLFLISKDGRVNQGINPTKEGRLHDFAWGRSSEGNNFFVIVGGAAPPVASLHNAQGGVLHQFEPGSYNSIRISPNGRILLLSGFGGMNGAMAFWDIATRKRLGPIVYAACVVHSEWSPDSKHLLTTTTRPRLQVDNGISVFNYRGQVVLRQPMNVLYDAFFVPVPKTAFPDRAPSPYKGDTAAGGVQEGGVVRSSGAYVPPSARAGASPVGIPGAVFAAPHLGRRGKKKNKNAQAGEGAEATEKPEKTEKAPQENKRKGASATAETTKKSEPTLAASSVTLVTSSAEIAKTKEIRKLQRKIREIEALKEEKAKGKNLDPLQEEKIKSEAEIKSQLASLGTVS